MLPSDPSFPLPTLVAHADWSASHKKRWMSVARLQVDNRYLAYPPERVVELSQFFRHLLGMNSRDGCILVGFDFPIGLPLVYANLAKIDNFLAYLPEFGRGDWVNFYEVAERPEQIGLYRPFYPNCPGGTRMSFLIDKLGLNPPEAIRRQCEYFDMQSHRRAACPLFWTLGAQQVGKAAISGWRDLLAPALIDQGVDLAIWPFSGRLVDLLKPGWVIACETYPAEFYTHLGLPATPARLRKRIQGSRQAQSERLLELSRKLDVKLAPHLVDSIQDGFGAAKDGEDRFDAVIGLLGMLKLLVGLTPIPEPIEPEIRSIEGWILGQAISTG